MDKPTVERIVHYVQSDESKWKGEHRPAVISQVWSDTCCNLTVFPGQTEDEQGLITSVTFDDKPTPGGRTWHWPERS